MGSRWGVTPHDSIQAECRRRGRDAVVDGCVRLLGSGTTDAALLLALAGPAGQKFLDGREHADTYWLRVWALRGLLWTWDERATDAVCAALRDEHWRVREMALKVVARHEIDEAFDPVVRLRDDGIPRVRSAAERAVVRLMSAAT
jgi:HEAT repeat protein